MESINTYFVTARPNEHASWKSFFIDVVINENENVETQIRTAVADRYSSGAYWDAQISNISFIHSKPKS